MNYLYKQALVWIGHYFPFVPRLFGLKVLAVGWVDFTPYIGASYEPKERLVESKVSMVLENCSDLPLGVKIIVECGREDDAWIRAYSVSPLLFDGRWDKDVCCGELKFEPEKKIKYKHSMVPPQDLVKVDCFAAQEPHPIVRSRSALKIEPEDSDVTIVYKDFLNQKVANVWLWFARSLIILFGIGLGLVLFIYFWGKYVLPVWHFLVAVFQGETINM
jgi:hypothetical protein